MPEQYTINGTITPADGVDRAGIKVQAFDRDMPSRERRTDSGPQLLGDKEAITDAEGRFQITYTLEQFQEGEGISMFRRLREKNADISFLIFDSAGQLLNIKGIEALGIVCAMYAGVTIKAVSGRQSSWRINFDRASNNTKR